MKKLIIILIFSFSLQSCAQEKETFWEIKSVYRVDEKPVKAIKDYFLAEIFKYNFNFKKRNDSLFFELPEKFEISLKNFKSISQLQIDNEAYFKMSNYEFEGDKFLIKFEDNTLTDPENSIIEFKKISKEQFDKNIAEAIAHQKEIAQKLSNLKNELGNNPPITLNNIKKLSLKSKIISNDKSENIELFIPNEIELQESGDIKNKKFGNIKIGTFRGSSKIYDIEHSDEDYGLKQLTIWVSTDTATFSMESYVSENPDMVVVRKGKDNVVGYIIRYDFENEKAVISSFFTLKYFKVGNSHIFIHSDVYRSQIKNYPNSEEMKKILNFNYLVSENITLKK